MKTISESSSTGLRFFVSPLPSSGENSVSSSQPFCCVPKRTRQVSCRTQRVWCRTQRVLSFETVLSKQNSAHGHGICILRTAANNLGEIPETGAGNRGNTFWDLFLAVSITLWDTLVLCAPPLPPLPLSQFQKALEGPPEIVLRLGMRSSS